MGNAGKITLSVIKADVGGPHLAALVRRVIGVGALELRERAAREDRHLVAVAGGLEKTEAIRASLKGRFFNVLITDAYVAEALMQG
jgi:DNA-binding transcriptional regulator LsrR (DeoR family)